MFRSFAVAFVIALVSLAPAVAFAQSGGRVLDLPTSIRSVGMGSTGSGVVWGDPDCWGNVASMASVSGVRWEHGFSRVLPELAKDLTLTTDRLVIGGGGIALMAAGNPGSIGRLKLSYGTSELTDINGNVIDRFESYESAGAEGIALSLPRLIDTQRGASGRDSHLADGFDLALGFTHKHTTIALAPYMDATSNETDWGVQARYSPLARRAIGPRFVCDLGAGYSEINATGTDFVFANDDVLAKPMRMLRAGVGARIGWVAPVALVESHPRWLGGFLPLATVGVAYDHSANGSADAFQPRYALDMTGIEVTIANVVALRAGNYRDRTGGIDGTATGWGLGLPLGPWGGFRIEHATQPRPRDSGLADMKLDGWSAWLDPLRILHDLQTRGGAR